MTRSLYALSICERNLGERYLFHFKGYYMGHCVKAMKLLGEGITVGEAYLLVIEFEKMKDETLYGRIKRSKKVFS